MEDEALQLGTPLWHYALLFGAIILVAAGLFPLLLKSVQQREEKRLEKLTETFDQLFIFLSPQKSLAFFGLVPIILGAMAFFVTRNMVIALVCAGMGFGLPFFMIKMMKHKRTSKFVHQLPDGLMILSSCLKGGVSLIQAIEILCGEMGPPISQEFGLVVREIRMGVSMEEAFKRLKERIPVEDVELIATAMLVARETGGNLVKIFGHLTTTVRDRIRLAETLKTTTLMAKVQGYIMSMIPVLFALFVRKIDPHHFDIMLERPEGQFLLGLAGVLWVVGMLLINKFSTIKF